MSLKWFVAETSGDRRYHAV